MSVELNQSCQDGSRKWCSLYSKPVVCLAMLNQLATHVIQSGRIDEANILTERSSNDVRKIDGIGYLVLEIGTPP